MRPATTTGSPIGCASSNGRPSTSRTWGRGWSWTPAWPGTRWPRWWTTSADPAYVEGVWVGGAGVVLLLHPAPGGDVVRGGRIVGEHPYDAADRHLGEGL